MRGIQIALAVACLAMPSCAVVDAAVNEPAGVTETAAVGEPVAATQQVVDDCDRTVDQYNEVANSAGEPVTQDEIEQLASDLVPCTTIEDILYVAVGWELSEQPLPPSAGPCLQPHVEKHPVSWLVVHHNQVHGIQTSEPHAGRWVDAMSGCVSAAYVLGAYLHDQYLEQEHSECYYRLYSADNFVPILTNLIKADDRIPLDDWPAEKARTAFGPMYECVDFLKDILGPEATALLSEETWECVKPLELKYLIYVQELREPDLSSFDEEFYACLSKEELQSREVQTMFGV